MNSTRREFRELVDGDEPILAPLCLDALTARIAVASGFKAGYLGGGALGYAMAVSEALLTLTEVADATRHMVQRSDLPIIVDAGVGFGDAVHVARTIWELETTGAVAVEIEDQVAPKRVSHHRGIEHLVSCEEMAGKIEHGVAARSDRAFLIIARTGAIKNEGFDAAVARAKAYHAAGADLIMLMPSNEEEWRRAPKLINAPLATIAPLDERPAEEWRKLGWRLIVDPLTTQVLVVEAIRNAYRRFQTEGKTGHDPRSVFEAYQRLPSLAGIAPLFEIEDRTTELGR